MSGDGNISTRAGATAGLVVLLGPPGSGKGTQAALLAARYGLEHVNTGALLRREIARQSLLGRQVEPYVRAGKHTPTRLLNGMIAERIKVVRSGSVLDGYPRNVSQASAFEASLQENGKSILAVVALELEDERAIERLAGRMVCEAEGHAYHQDASPPAKAGVCDVDGSDLVARQDDRDSAAVERRLALYRMKTVPVLRQYDQQGLLLRIDANRSPAEVAQNLCAGLPASLSRRHQPVEPIYREADPGRRDTRVRSVASE